MADNKINVTVSANTRKNITVSSAQQSTEITASTDTGRFWAQTAENWAVSDVIVDNTDFSSKHYAQEAKESAISAGGFETSVRETYNSFINDSQTALNELQANKELALENIETSKNDSVAEIQATENSIVKNIETVVETEINNINKEIEQEKQEINNLANFIKENAKDIASRTSFSMFDTILKDHILSYEDSKGLVLQGTYAYKNAIAGSRYGYPDFYNKCLEEMNLANLTEVTLGDSTITMYVNTNGHQFYNIADKEIIDNFFNTYGFAWFYGVDTENERIFLPRNNYFEQATSDVSEVGQSVEAGLPNITGEFGAFYNNYQTGAFYVAQGGVNGHGNANTQNVRVGFNASRSSSIYGNSNTVQPNAVKKLLYICVGNTTSYEGITEVVNQGMEILEQVNQGIESRASIDASNFTAEGKSLIAGYPIPDYENRITMSNGFIAPSNGWIVVRGFTGTSGTNCFVYVNGVEIGGMSSGGGQVTGATQIMVSTGDKITWNNGALASYFFPLKGDK